MRGDAGFKKRLKVGLKYERKVCEFLNENGIECTCPTVGENHTEKDIDILLKDGRVIEVKSRRGTCRYTCPEDFPFETVFCDTEGGYAAKEIKPAYYVFISQINDAIVWVDGDTRDQWHREKIYDRVLGYSTWTLCAPKELLRSVDELLEELKDGN